MRYPPGYSTQIDNVVSALHSESADRECVRLFPIPIACRYVGAAEFRTKLNGDVKSVDAATPSERAEAMFAARDACAMAGSSSSAGKEHLVVSNVNEQWQFASADQTGDELHSNPKAHFSKCVTVRFSQSAARVRQRPDRSTLESAQAVRAIHSSSQRISFRLDIAPIFRAERTIPQWNIGC